MLAQRERYKNGGHIRPGLKWGWLLSMRALRAYPKKKALGKVSEAFGVSESYLKHALTLAKLLPSIYKVKSARAAEIERAVPAVL